MRRLVWLIPALLASCPPAYAGAWACTAAGLGVAVLAVVTLLCFVFAGGMALCAAEAHWQDRLPGWIFLALLLLLLALMPGLCRADIPAEAQKHRRDLVRLAQREMGLDAPIATLAAQIHQESRWNPHAVSPAGAQGMAQFMPGTAVWMAQLRRDLAAPDPFNPLWAIRGMVVYDAWLLARVQARGPCDKWAMALCSYNGGLGWCRKDARLASSKGDDPLAWWNSVERHNSGRSAANFRESRGYPRLILRRWEPLYVRAGWGSGVCA